MPTFSFGTVPSRKVGIFTSAKQLSQPVQPAGGARSGQCGQEPPRGCFPLARDHCYGSWVVRCGSCGANDHTAAAAAECDLAMLAIADLEAEAIGAEEMFSLYDYLVRCERSLRFE